MSIGTWGNREYTLDLFGGRPRLGANPIEDWPTLQTINFEDPGLNEEDYPVITWIFARKI